MKKVAIFGLYLIMFYKVMLNTSKKINDDFKFGGPLRHYPGERLVLQPVLNLTGTFLFRDSGQT